MVIRGDAIIVSKIGVAMLHRRVPVLFILVLILSSCGAQAQSEVVLGDERLGEYLPLLSGKRVAIFSNHSGIVGDIFDGRPYRVIPDDSTSLVPFHSIGDERLGPHILDVLVENGVNVTAIFSPEHGFRGDADAGEHVGSSVDQKTGVPILSLYDGGRMRPSDSAMESFDVLVVDIQDVGLRYYTYYISMLRLMDACSAFSRKVVVLDRPNPNGFYVDGPILDDSLRSGVGALPIPVVHGMTLGELALMINGEGWLEGGRKCDLAVIPCLGYSHSTKYSLILPPSPNLRCMKAVYLYSSICFFEGVQATPGRGTPYPFMIYGHPDMAGYGFSFTPRSVPGARNPRYKDVECHGVDLRRVPLERIWDEGVNLSYIADAYRSLNRPAHGYVSSQTPPVPMGDGFFLSNGFFEKLVGVTWVRGDIESSADPSKIREKWKGDVESFLLQRRPYLLYPE